MNSSLLNISLFVLIGQGFMGNTAASTNSSTVYIASWVEGKWQIQDDKGKENVVTLYPDGSALGTDGSIGSWYFFDRGISIIWISGWVDVIEKHGDSYVKMGYSPGTATTSSPTNQSPAKKLPADANGKNP